MEGMQYLPLQFAIEDFYSYKDGKQLIRKMGRFVRLTFEVCPATISVSTGAIRTLVEHQLQHWEVPLTFDQISLYLLDVALKGIDFKDIKGSEYIGRDYYKLKHVFALYKYERTSFIVTRRQYAYTFGEKLCMNGIQFFEDNRLCIVNFRSCDYIKKFPFDILLINSLCLHYGFCIDRIFCNFGSLHYYDADNWKL